MAIEDYFKGSSQAYGQIAGSLLAGRKKKDKKQAKRALIASTVMAGFGALQNQQKQTIIDGVNDTNEKYGEIFKLNKSEFESFGEERKLLKEYNDNPETFLNDAVTKIIDSTDEAKEAGVTYGNKDNEPEVLRKSLEASFNSERERLFKKMEALKADKRVTTRTFEQFNQKATDEYKAAMALVEDDPTKKGLIKAAWNRIFNTERNEEGELVTTNSDLLDLQKDLKVAKEGRTTFRDSIENQTIEDKIYKPLNFTVRKKDINKIYATVIPTLRQTFGNDVDFKDVDRTFYTETVDSIIAENPRASAEDIGYKAYAAIAKKEIDPQDYLNRRGVLNANGQALIESYAKATQDGTAAEFIKANPMMLGQLADAYVREGRENEANILLKKHEDVYTTSKIFEPSPQQKIRYIEKIRATADRKKDRVLLANTDLLAVLSDNAARAANYYIENNPEWKEKGYIINEIEQAALDFARESYNNGELINNRMTEAEMLPYRIHNNSNSFDKELINDIPKMISGLKDSYIDPIKQEKEITGLRDGFVELLNNNYKIYEMSLDEKEEIQKIILDKFSNEKILSYEESVAKVFEEEKEVSLEERIQTRISNLPEQTPVGSFISGDSRKRNIISQESLSENQKEIKTFTEKKNIIRSKLRTIEKNKTTKINRNLFTRPSEKEAKEIQDENARRVSDILQSKYGLSTNTSNVQKLNNKLNTLLKDSPETYDEIINILNTYE